jgi:hypothetical protein
MAKSHSFAVTGPASRHGAPIASRGMCCPRPMTEARGRRGCRAPFQRDRPSGFASPVPRRVALAKTRGASLEAARLVIKTQP